MRGTFLTKLEMAEKMKFEFDWDQKDYRNMIAVTMVELQNSREKPVSQQQQPPPALRTTFSSEKMNVFSRPPEFEFAFRGGQSQKSQDKSQGFDAPDPRREREKSVEGPLDHGLSEFYQQYIDNKGILHCIFIDH